MKRARASKSSAEVGSSAITISGSPTRARAAATRCCWPTESLDTGAVGSSFSSTNRRCSSKPRGSGHATVRLGRARGSAPGEVAGQDDVLGQVEIGDQVELLKDEPDVVGAKSVASGRGQRARILLHQRQAARIRRQYSCQQVQQRRLAATRGAADIQVFAASQEEAVATEQRRSAGPTEAQVLDFDELFVHLGHRLA